MDVRVLSLGAVLLLSSACTTKTSSSVFRDNSKATSSVCGANRMAGQYIVHWEDGRVTIERNPDVEEFTKEFIESNLSRIKNVEFDRKIELPRLQVDEVSTLDTTTMDHWGQDIVQASSAWGQNVLGKNVKVAVIDAAVDYSHPQIAPRLDKNLAEINGKTGIDDDGNGFIDDYYGWDFYRKSNQPVIMGGNIHGTHVSGIILADRNTGSMQGLAPEASLVPINFMDDYGGGSIGSALQAISYAASRGARIINASWGAPGCSQELQSAIGALAAKGILFVAAAGNDGEDFDISPADYWTYPAAFNFPHQLTVAWTRPSEYLSVNSNRSSSLVHLGAPGEKIWSSVPKSYAATGYAALSGTSMAAPFVSGAAALLWGERPKASVFDIRRAILEAVDVPNGVELKVSTRGRLNVDKAVAKIRALVNP